MLAVARWARPSPGICRAIPTSRERRGHRARSDLRARLVGAVGELDPAAVLDAAQHPSVALRHRLPAPGEGAARCRSRAEGAGLSVPGEPGGRGGAAGQQRDPEGRGLRGRAARSGGAGRAVSRRSRARASALASHGTANEGWFDGPALMQALPAQGARAGRRVHRRRGRGAGAARGHAALGPHARGADHRHRRRPVVGRGRRHGRHRPAGRAAPPLGLRVRCAARRCRRCRSPSIRRASGSGRRAASIIAGTTPAPGNDPPGAPLEVQHQEWDDMVWPALAQRVPAFEAAKVVNSWAGYYEYNTFDQNGIVGRHPEIDSIDLRHRLFRPRHPAVAGGRPRRRRADRARQLSHARSLALRL